MKKIAPNEQFQLGDQVFVYNLNYSGGIILKPVKKGTPNKPKFVPPTLQQVKDFFKLKGYSEESAIKFHEYYEMGDWKDAKGNQVKNWKQKAMAVWFRDENKIKETIKDKTKETPYLF